MTCFQLTRKCFYSFLQTFAIFFAKLYNSKKDFINWSGQDYLLLLDSWVYSIYLQTFQPTWNQSFFESLMQIITQSFFSHCSNPEKMELPEPETNTSSRPPGIHQKLRGYYQEGVRWCLLKRKWKKTSVLVVNPTTIHYSTIILLLLLIPLHSVSFFEFSVQFLIIKAKAT